MGFLLIGHICHVAGITEFVAENRTDISSLPVHLRENIPVLSIERQERGRKGLAEVLQDRAAFDDVWAIVPQRGYLLIEIALGEVSFEMFTLQQVNHSDVNLPKINTSLDELFDHDGNFPAVGRRACPEFEHGDSSRNGRYCRSKAQARPLVYLGGVRCFAFARRVFPLRGHLGDKQLMS